MPRLDVLIDELVYDLALERRSASWDDIDNLLTAKSEKDLYYFMRSVNIDPSPSLKDVMWKEFVRQELDARKVGTYEDFDIRDTYAEWKSTKH